MLASTMNGSRQNAHSYEETINTLNTMQNLHQTAAMSAKRHNPLTSTSVQDSIKYLLRSGITLEQLNALSIIHVAGTKGKGSTCAFVESILREHGYRTGFFSSPHLISVCERFKINGRQISETDFVHYFWKVYDILSSKRDSPNDYPSYFPMLTIVMFHLFLEANLDVAIIEVGIGGEFDCTNIIQNPVCTGVTSLGLDHVNLLGNTIESIAFQKSGIFKRHCPAFTVSQPEEAMEVMKMRAYDKECDLTVVPSLSSYPWINGEPKLGIDSTVQRYNASLAIQLSNCWLARITSNSNTDNLISPCDTLKQPKFNLSMEKVSEALTNCKWPGRTQIMRGKMADFYLDGAHTVESLTNCVTWFQGQIKESEAKRYLVFNLTNNRNPKQMLEVLKRINFDLAYFVPNIAGYIKKSDQNDLKSKFDEQMQHCFTHKRVWGDSGVVAESVEEAFQMIFSQTTNEEKPNVLITGSLYLVGAALLILDPQLTMKTDL